MNQPHFVRFAQALALVTGLAGCSMSTTQGTDSGNGGADSGNDDDAAVVADGGGTDGGGDEEDAATVSDAGTAEDAASGQDAGELADAGAFDCTTCVCWELPDVDAGLPTCDSLGGTFPCCAAIGPLAPPDLVV